MNNIGSIEKSLKNFTPIVTNVVIDRLTELFIEKFQIGKSSESMFYVDKCDCCVSVDAIQKQIFIKFHRPYRTQKFGPINKPSKIVWTSSYLYQLNLKEFLKRHCEKSIHYELERILFDVI